MVVWQLSLFLREVSHFFPADAVFLLSPIVERLLKFNKLHFYREICGLSRFRRALFTLL
jgi:hypothetical protein